jgi:hypothetical protein
VRWGQGYAKGVETGLDTGRSGRGSRTRVLVLATEELTGKELVEELRGHLREAGSTEVMVIVPAVEKTAFQHALGDVDKAVKEAEQRLETSLEELDRAGIPALGEVGDSDPLLAAEDALREFVADEVMIVAHARDQARWFENDLFERAQEELRPALRLVTVRRDDDEREPHLAGIEEAGPGHRPPPGAGHELTLSPNMPRFTAGDLVGILVAIVGTILAIVLAAAGPGAESAGGAAQILIAMAVALINMAHVVGLTLLESVGHHGGWQRFFRNLSMVATPAAVVANGLISLLA